MPKRTTNLPDNVTSSLSSGVTRFADVHQSVLRISTGVLRPDSSIVIIVRNIRHKLPSPFLFSSFLVFLLYVLSPSLSTSLPSSVSVSLLDASSSMNAMSSAFS
jgi:hypothetical protein